MTSSTSGRHRAEAFARDVADRSTPAGQLAARLEALGAASVAAPAPDFRAALRTRLVAVAAVQPAGTAAAPEPAPWRAALDAVATRLRPWAAPSRTAPRGLAVAAGAMASVVVVTGIGVASTRSLPGDAFYGVKRQAEALELRLADGAVEKGTTHLEHAATRLREVRALALGRDELALGTTDVAPALAAGTTRSTLGGSRESRVAAALDDMDEATRAGERLLTSAYRERQDPAPLRVLARFAQRQTSALAEVIPSLPAAARPRAQASLALVERVESETGELLAQGACSAACDPASAAPTTPPSSTPGPGAQPAPSSSSDEQPCGCPPAPQPEPTPTPAETSDPEPTGSPEPSPSATRTPSPTPSPTSSSGPLPLPPLPVPLPTAIPTLTPLPLPAPVASAVPSLAVPAAQAGQTTRVVTAAAGSRSGGAPTSPTAPRPVAAHPAAAAAPAAPRSAL